MWEKIKGLRNINNTLYIYATQSGILLITSDLKYYYYSLFLDKEPKALGLFIVDYPKTAEQCAKLDARLNFDTDYGIPISDINTFNALKSFEDTTPEETMVRFDIRYALYQVMADRLLKFTTNSGEYKPFTRHICIDTTGDKATLAASDCKTLCVFGEIPVMPSNTEPTKYIISKEMVLAIMRTSAEDIDDSITFSKIRKSPEGEYRIQAICGNYLFVEKQGIHIYPTYMEVVRHYLYFPYVATNVNVGQYKIQGIKSLPSKEVSDQKLIKIKDLVDMLAESHEDMPEVYFDIEFVERVFNNLTALSCTITNASKYEQMQIDCRWGKNERYTQHLCVMPVNPEFLRAKELCPTNSSEPISTCNLKTIKTVI